MNSVSINREVIEALPINVREAICKELAWWKDPEKRLVHWREQTLEGVKETLEPFGIFETNEWAAFMYEATARKAARTDGEYRWSGGAPFCELSLEEAHQQITGRSISTDLVTIFRQGRINPQQMAPGYSLPISINLAKPTGEVLRFLKHWINDTKDSMGVSEKRRHAAVPWEGLELYDREFILGETYCADRRERKSIQKAFATFEELSGLKES